MNNLTEELIQFQYMNRNEFDKGIEFHNHKILPSKENVFLNNFLFEDEWQQEYYIIYNSYILEEKENDGSE